MFVGQPVQQTVAEIATGLEVVSEEGTQHATQKPKIEVVMQKTAEFDQVRHVLYEYLACAQLQLTEVATSPHVSTAFRPSSHVAAQDLLGRSGKLRVQ